MPELNDQNFYYRDLRGRLLGNKARESLIVEQLSMMSSKDFFLDVGCAQGHFEKIAAGFSENVFGGDYNFEKLPSAKNRLGQTHFVGINAEMLPFKSNSFDIVLCTEVLEHVPDWKLALKELQRVSRKKIIITVPLEKGFFWNLISVVSSMDSRGHLHKLDTAELRNAIGAGWRVLESSVIATPSRRLNRLVNRLAPEPLGMYAMLLLEKDSGQ
jgi:SAM-dependent methyltransferase